MAVAGEAKLDYYAVDAAHMMSIIEPADEAIMWNKKAMAMAEASNDKRARMWLGALYNNIGWHHHDKGEYKTALRIFEKAVAWREAHGQAEATRIAWWCVARTYRSLGRIDETLAMQQRMYEQLKAAGRRSGFVDEELGECYLLKGQPQRAREHFAAAYGELIKDAWLVRDEPQRLARLKKLSGLE